VRAETTEIDANKIANGAIAIMSATSSSLLLQ
jgi:hypothetical protein